jgi:hypothetical protein
VKQQSRAALVDIATRHLTTQCMLCSQNDWDRPQYKSDNSTERVKLQGTISRLRASVTETPNNRAVIPGCQARSRRGQAAFPQRAPVS